jgi:hypothetical protein
VKAIKNGQEETGDAPHSGGPTSATDEHHMEQVKSVLECMHSTSCTATVTKIGISPATNKSLCKWIPHMLNDDRTATHVRLTNTHLQHQKNQDNAFLDRILMADMSWMHLCDPQLKQQNAE